MKRSQMVPDRVYYVRKDNVYAVTPDCVGVYWYDTKDEAFEQHGSMRVLGVNYIAD